MSGVATKTSNHSTDNNGKNTSGPNCTCTNNNNSEWMCLFIIVMSSFYVDSINTSSLTVSMHTMSPYVIHCIMCISQ